MRRQKQQVWLNPSLKKSLKRLALEKNKPLLDLTDEDLNFNTKKKQDFRFRL